LARKWAKSQTPATTTIKATTNRSGCLDVKNFILCAATTQPAPIRVGDDIRVIRGSKPLKKFQKNQKKSLPAVGLFRYTGNSSDKQHCLAVQKKCKKVKKKLVRPLEI
jgi:hypothetical protein